MHLAKALRVGDTAFRRLETAVHMHGASIPLHLAHLALEIGCCGVELPIPALHRHRRTLSVGIDGRLRRSVLQLAKSLLDGVECLPANRDPVRLPCAVVCVSERGVPPLLEQLAEAWRSGAGADKGRGCRAGGVVEGALEDDGRVVKSGVSIPESRRVSSKMREGQRKGEGTHSRRMCSVLCAIDVEMV